MSFKMFNTSAGAAKLTSDAKLTREDFSAIASAAGVPPFKARKSALVSARPATATERIDTRWNGKETTNIALAGDYVVTSLDKSGHPLVDKDGQRNIYVITGDTFSKLYEAADEQNGTEVFRARGSVLAIEFPGGFEIVAPWGELQTADKGYLIQNGPDIYGNNAETFEASYERIE